MTTARHRIDELEKAIPRRVPRRYLRRQLARARWQTELRDETLRRLNLHVDALEHRLRKAEAGLAPAEAPLLGLATTRELLTELAARLGTAHPSIAGPGVVAGDAFGVYRAAMLGLDRLPASVLNYRTVDQ